jgi:4-alpha-glucanotransferase
MNYPGRAAGNWRWRFCEGALAGELLDQLTAWTEVYRRAPQSPDPH